MLRSFLPIGQGGFAVEQFDDARYNVVFDCGTSTANGKSSARQAIEDQIRQTFDPKTKIQIVFFRTSMPITSTDCPFSSVTAA